jgi:hypothetical protein
VVATKLKFDPRTLVLLLGGVGAGAGFGLVFLLLVWLVMPRGGTTPASPAPAAAQSPSAKTAPEPPAAPITAEQVASAARALLQRPPDGLADVQGKLKKIALAFHNFHDRYRLFAVPTVGSTLAAQGKTEFEPTALSWRVHLLPFLDQKPLYDKFHLNEPWDSPHNKTLLAQMPEVYSLGASTEPTTRFQVLTGPDLLFGSDKPPALREVSDGTPHTILIVTVGADRSVPWTQPADVIVDKTAPLAGLGTLADGLLPCAMVDGSVLTLRAPIYPATFLAVATPHGGEVADSGWLRRQFDEGRSQSLTSATSPPASPTAAPASAAATPAPRADPNAPVSPDQVHAKLQAVAFAFMLHNDFFGMYLQPMGATAQRRDQRLSWRVHLLPFLGQESLYARFHLNEPWDSPHNKTLLPEMPDVYRFGGTAADKTRIRLFAGPKLVFGHDRPMSAKDIPDGPANTVLAALVAPHKALFWTEPQLFELNPDSGSLQRLLLDLAGGTLECITADGKLLSLPANVPLETLQALITPAGKEPVDAAALRKQHGPDYSPDANLVQGVKMAMNWKQERMLKLKNIVRAMQGFHDTYRRFPLAENAKHFDAAGKPHLSWRVHILPFLEQEPLYKRFKLDQPWDSPDNQALLAAMPDAYRDPADASNSTTTRFVTITGPQTAFAGQYGPKVANFADGTARTILVLRAGRNKAVPWTKPEDVVFDPEAPLACLGEPDGLGILFARADGAVEFVKRNLPPECFKALVTPAGGEELPPGMSIYGLRAQ